MRKGKKQTLEQVSDTKVSEGIFFILSIILFRDENWKFQIYN